jgi:mannose-6-phosphate isomerase-like protein (cupin superfamily)
VSYGGRNVVLGPGEGRHVELPGQSCTYKAVREETAGAYALIEATLIGSGPPQHIHHAEEEAIYVLEGEINIQVGNQTHHATRGSFVLVPRGTVHTYWNAGTTDPKILIIVSPPGFEQLFTEVVGDEVIDPATFVMRVSELAAKYQMEITGPPRG